MTTLIKRLMRAGTVCRGTTVSTSAALSRRETKPAPAVRQDTLATDWNSTILSYENFR